MGGDLRLGLGSGGRLFCWCCAVLQRRCNCVVDSNRDQPTKQPTNPTRPARNVAHRDLKLENLLLATPDDITQVGGSEGGGYVWTRLYPLLAHRPASASTNRPTAQQTAPIPSHPPPLRVNHQVKIADFGLAKRSAAGAMSTVCGTPQYVAPEVIQGTPGLMYGPKVGG
jgi:serine/threonine protein kinase